MDAARNHPDRIQIAFDDHPSGGANAGLILPATLALAPRSAATS